MNTIKQNILFAGLAALMMTSCTDSFLDTTSKTSLTSTNYYKTASQAESAVIGCYDRYQNTVSNGNMSLYQISELMSDDCFGGGGPDDVDLRLLDRMDQSMRPASTNLLGGIWGDYYKCIYNCNLLIGSLDNISWTSDAERKSVEGQARAIRALAYFDLVRMFENVPLLTVPSSEKVPQANPDEVYKLIVEDLKYAADNIPADKFTDNSSTLGRISRYAAAGMLARVYLFYDGVYNNNEFKTMPGELTKADALKYCEEVISSGKFKLEDNYADLWRASSALASNKEQGLKDTYKEASQEILWVVKFNNDQTWSGNSNGNRFVINIGMRNTWAAPYGFGWGACTVTNSARNVYSDDDKRRDASIIDARNLMNNDGNSTVYEAQAKTDACDLTGYNIKKYTPLVYNDGSFVVDNESDVSGHNFMTSQDADWILLRYSDVLLMAAELGSGNAVQDYNSVMYRAYGNHEHDVAAAPTREQIWQERRREFMGEGIRYFDLRRQGLDAFVKGIMGQAYDNGSTFGTPTEVYANTQKTTIADTYKEQNIREKRGFWQIPSSEISLSGGVYKQNTGW